MSSIPNSVYPSLVQCRPLCQRGEVLCIHVLPNVLYPYFSVICCCCWWFLLIHFWLFRKLRLRSYVNGYPSPLRCTEYLKEDVLPSCQLTLKNLQLDYLDLYLVHWPIALAKESTSNLAILPDEHRLGYDPEREAKTWQVPPPLVSQT